MHLKKPTTIAIASLTILIAFLLVTNPATLPSIFFVVPFVLLFVAIYALSYVVIRKLGFTHARAMHMGLVVAGLPVSLLLLQSIGQLTVRDVLTILIFFSVAYFYVSRIASQPQKGE